MNENDTNHKNDSNSNNNDNNNNSYQMKKPNIDLIIDNAIRLSNENLFIQWQLRMINNDDDDDGKCNNQPPKYQYPLFKIFPDKIHETKEKILIIFDGKIFEKHYGGYNQLDWDEMD
ncbi:hypothetical protein BLA29_009126 [Euroglyphus maynei]|uniref:Uncharacterized protein n=1 Tax=Euroglyphus maynei TaxID=6958 RepID=A0A1Y3BCA8_EURMA|nr:hypothetical protein BLA29_009126 [Euroglyphus maynei]